MKINDKWDLVIDATSQKYTLNLNGIWKYRDLLILLIRRDFVSFYKQTIFGPIWFFVQPIFLTITYVFVFGRIANIETSGIPQPLFYLTGVMVWSFFSENLLKCSTVFKDNYNIFGKVYFPRLIVPLSILLSSLIKFLIQFILLFIVIIYYVNVSNYNINITNIFLLPFLTFLLSIQAMGIGLAISALTIKYRDLALLFNFGIQLLMYVSPVLYPMSQIEGNMRIIVDLNPISNIIEGFRFGLFGEGYFNYIRLLYSILISLIIFFIGVFVFNKAEKNFIDTV